MPPRNGRVAYQRFRYSYRSSKTYPPLTHPAHTLYNTGIAIYAAAVRVASVWNSKARKMVQGWRTVWQNKPLEGRTAWFHAPSLGEYEQARPVITRFKQEHPDYRVWLTFFSPSGYEVRKNSAEADRVTYLPMDTLRNSRRLVRIINPSVAFFVKYDFWFNTLRELRSRQVPTFIFSAIFRPEHYFFKPYGGWYARQLECFTHIFVQNDESLQLLHNRGIERCTKAGDTRFDRVREIALSSEGDPVVESFLSHSAGDTKCLMAGSSWEPDEQNLKTYLDHCGTPIKLILAPHVISDNHLTKIEYLFDKERCIRYSKLSEALKHSSIPSFKHSANILIIDNIGLLSRLYRYADIAYIGGGFGRGIHNILEAVTYGKPVVFGPNHRKFQEAKDIIALGGGFSYNTKTELTTILDRLLGDKAAQDNAAAACRVYMEANIGSTTAIIQTVNKYLSL